MYSYIMLVSCTTGCLDNSTCCDYKCNICYPTAI